MSRPSPRLILLGLLFSGLTTSPAHAILIAVDDPVFGPGAITHDTETGLDWLDLTFSTNASYNSVSTHFGGFRYASMDEVSQLFDNAGLTERGDVPFPPPPGLLTLIALLGATSYQEGHPELLGITSTPYFAGEVYYRIASIDFFTLCCHPGNDPYYFVSTGPPQPFSAASPESASPLIGSFLIAVPEPTSAVLIGAGLLALQAVRRRARP